MCKQQVEKRCCGHNLIEDESSMFKCVDGDSAVGFGFWVASLNSLGHLKNHQKPRELEKMSAAWEEESE